MDLNQSKIVRNVWKILFDYKYVLYFLNQNKHLCSYFDNTKVIFDEFECETVSKLNNGFLINEKFYWDSSTKKFLFDIQDTYVELQINETDLLIRIIDFINEHVSYSVYSLLYGIKSNINNSTSISPRFIISANSFVSFRDDVLLLYHIDKNEIIWQLNTGSLLNNKDVTQTGEIISYKDKLFIYLYDNEDKRATIVLDIETGYELFRTSEFMGYIRLQEDRIYALYGKTVSILNPESYQIRRIDLSEELAVLDESIEEFLGAESLGYTTIEFKLSPTIYEVRYPYLYFAQERGAQVGVLNLETEKLEWHATMDIDYPVNPVVMDIKACENRLYVHCADTTLHIFEME